MYNITIDPISGLTSKRLFPYESHFWKYAGLNEAYYLGIESVTGMEPENLVKIMSKIEEMLTSYNVIDIQAVVRSDENKYSSVSGILTDQVKAIENDWYADQFYMTTSFLDNSKLFLESENDGTQVGLFAYDNSSIELLSNIRNMLVK